MNLTHFFSLLSFLWVTAITPGPNNTLLAASGANHGWRRSLPLALGIMLGVQCLLLLSAFGVGGLLLLYPKLQLGLKIIGSLYLLWLAWKIGTAKYQRLPTEVKLAAPIRFWQGALLQLVNPKAWLMALGAVASFSVAGSGYLRSVAAIGAALLLVNLAAGFSWLLFGRLISHWLRSQRAWVAFNLTMGVLTAACVVLVWL